MFKKLFSKRDGSDQSSRLTGAVAAAMPDADEDTHRIVAAITGLLAQVAYADRDYAPEEEQRIREELARVRELDGSGVAAIIAVLREHVGHVSAVEVPWHARALRELCDRSFRLQILDVLVDVAAADGEISLAETNVMRHTATALGLTQDDYNQAQARHRDKLSVLR
jgi:uncharacterized tellurite resistance protein B-like protein